MEKYFSLVGALCGCVLSWPGIGPGNPHCCEGQNDSLTAGLVPAWSTSKKKKEAGV